MIRKILKVLGAIVLVIAVVAILIVTLTAESRDIARSFVLGVSAGNYDEAHAYLHDALKLTYTVEAMANAFERAAPYAEVGFNSVASSGNGTELHGTARTAGGCSTPVMVRVLDGQIIAFEMAPLCPE